MAGEFFNPGICTEVGILAGQSQRPIITSFDNSADVEVAGLTSSAFHVETDLLALPFRIAADAAERLPFPCQPGYVERRMQPGVFESPLALEIKAHET